MLHQDRGVRLKAAIVRTACLLVLSAVLLFVGLIVFILDVHNAIVSCWRQLDYVTPRTVNISSTETFEVYEPECVYYNQNIVIVVAVLLGLGGIITIMGLISFCRTLNMRVTAQTSKIPCSNQSLCKGWVSLFTLSALFLVYSMAFFIKFSHHPASNRPGRENDSITYAFVTCGAFFFMALALFMAVIGVMLLCYMDTEDPLCKIRDGKHKYEPKKICVEV